MNPDCQAKKYFRDAELTRNCLRLWIVLLLLLIITGCQKPGSLQFTPAPQEPVGTVLQPTATPPIVIEPVNSPTVAIPSPSPTSTSPPPAASATPLTPAFDPQKWIYAVAGRQIYAIAPQRSPQLIFTLDESRAPLVSLAGDPLVYPDKEGVVWWAAEPNGANPHQIMDRKTWFSLNFPYVRNYSVKALLPHRSAAVFWGVDKEWSAGVEVTYGYAVVNLSDGTIQAHRELKLYANVHMCYRDGRYPILSMPSTIRLLDLDSGEFSTLLNFDPVRSGNVYVYPQIIWKSDCQGFYAFIPGSSKNRLYEIQPGGQRPRLVGAYPVDFNIPEISPDDRQIVVWSQQASLALSIDASSGKTRQLPPETARLLAWAPDGQRFLASDNGVYTDFPGEKSYFIADLDGNVTDLEDVTNPDGSTTLIGQAAWLDDETLVYISQIYRSDLGDWHSSLFIQKIGGVPLQIIPYTGGGLHGLGFYISSQPPETILEALQAEHTG